MAIITGGTSGLGLEAARQLLLLNLSHLIITARSTAKGNTAAVDLRRGTRDAKIEVWPMDMCSYQSIQGFACRVDTDLPRLDMVILNAGVRNSAFRTVESTGHEETTQVNYLSTVLLAILLLPSLKIKSPANSPGRLTIVNAALSLAAKFPQRASDPLLSSFDNENQFDTIEYYNSSKLLAHMFLWKLVEYIAADDVVVNLADPGFVKGTNLARDARVLGRTAVKLLGVVTGRSISVGASTYLDAVLWKGKESHGCFIMSWEIHP